MEQNMNMENRNRTFTVYTPNQNAFENNPFMKKSFNEARALFEKKNTPLESNIINKKGGINNNIGNSSLRIRRILNI